MQSQPENTELKKKLRNPENFHTCKYPYLSRNTNKALEIPSMHKRSYLKVV